MKKLFLSFMAMLLALTLNAQSNSVRKLPSLKELKTTFQKNIEKIKAGTRNPSLKQLITIYNEIENGNSNALKDNDFKLVDMQSQKVVDSIVVVPIGENDSDENDSEIIAGDEHTFIKEVYNLNYANGLMTAVHVHEANKIGTSELIIVCNRETWEILQKEYRDRDRDNSVEDNISIDFKMEGSICFRNKKSVHWPWWRAPISFLDLMSFYNKRQDINFVNQELACSGLTPSNGEWSWVDEWGGGKLSISVNAQSVLVEAPDDESDYLLSILYKWINEAHKEGFISNESKNKTIRRIEFYKKGAPVVSCVVEYSAFKFCIGNRIF